MVSTIEKALQTQEIGLGAFRDIERVLDRTSIEAITSALLRHGVPPLFERWIASMLSRRCIISSLMGETLQVASVRGCPLGGVLSPLLWNFNRTPKREGGEEYLSDRCLLPIYLITRDQIMN